MAALISYSIIVPDSMQVELIGLGEKSSAISWQIGDITNQLKTIWDTIGRDNPEMKIADAAIYSAVASFCGKSARTVREYAHLSNFFPEGVREWYSILSIDHFRTAATLGPDWEKALKWAVEQSDKNGGRPATVDAMIAEFAPGMNPPENPPDNDTDTTESELALDGALTPYQVLRSFLTNARKVKEVLPNLGIVGDDIERISTALDIVFDILAKV